MLNILLAEDNPGDVALVKLALAEHHILHALHVVTDGAEAVEFVKGMGMPGHPPCPDLLLLDINLPKVEGPKVLQEFRKRAHCGKTAVIVVTSSNALSDRLMMAALGVSSYFCKPGDLDEFMCLGGLVKDVVAKRLSA